MTTTDPVSSRKRDSKSIVASKLRKFKAVPLSVKQFFHHATNHLVVIQDLGMDFERCNINTNKIFNEIMIAPYRSMPPKQAVIKSLLDLLAQLNKPMAKLPVAQMTDNRFYNLRKRHAASVVKKAIDVQGVVNFTEMENLHASGFSDWDRVLIKPMARHSETTQLPSFLAESSFFNRNQSMVIADKTLWFLGNMLIAPGRGVIESDRLCISRFDSQTDEIQGVAALHILEGLTIDKRSFMWVEFNKDSSSQHFKTLAHQHPNGCIVLESREKMYAAIKSIPLFMDVESQPLPVLRRGLTRSPFSC